MATLVANLESGVVFRLVVSDANGGGKKTLGTLDDLPLGVPLREYHLERPRQVLFPRRGENWTGGEGDGWMATALRQTDRLANGRRMKSPPPDL